MQCFLCLIASYFQEHPDQNKGAKSHERFVKINEAYNVLSKESSRRDYDISLQLNNQPSGGGEFRSSWPSTQHPGHFKHNPNMQNSAGPFSKEYENDPFGMGNKDYFKNRE